MLIAGPSRKKLASVGMDSPVHSPVNSLAKGMSLAEEEVSSVEEGRSLQSLVVQDSHVRLVEARML